MLVLSLIFIAGLSVNSVLSITGPNRRARLGEFPYHVSIQNIDSSYHHCGGIIINPYYVLTAAHCIDGFNPEEFQIVAGIIDLLAKDKTIRNVVELISHEKYDECIWKNDIGLIKVQEPFHFNNTIDRAYLPKTFSNIHPGTKATVIGFGRNPHGYTSKWLEEADVLVKDLYHCNDKYKRAGLRFGNTQICAQNSDGSGICKGDSGGAFIVDGLVVGISSFTNGDCDHIKYPSVFTKISKYRAWIHRQIIKDLISKL